MHSETMTMATDLLLGLVSIGLGLHLLRARRMPMAGAAFFAMGFAALAGGAYHGVAGLLGEPVVAPMFRAVLVIIGVSNLLLAIAVLDITGTKENRRLWIIALVAKLATYLVWVIRSTEFLPAICDYAVTLAMIFWLSGKASPKFTLPIRAGVLVSLVASAVQVGHVAPSASFNHNDLYHVIQIAAVVLIHRGFTRVHT